MFGSTWEHHLTISGQASGGSQDGDGDWNPGSAGSPVYDGKCDAQEPSQGGLKITTGETDIESTTADLLVFLKDEAKIYDLKPDMKGTLTRGSRTDQIVITNVRIIDGMIEANTV